MSTIVLNGKEISVETRIQIKEQADRFKSLKGRACGLAVIIVGDDPASKTYVANKIKGCAEVGFKSLHLEFPENATQDEILSAVDKLANDETIDGILVQLPLPKHLNEKEILSHIPDSKDVDGFSPDNMGRLCMNMPRTVSCTPLGIMKLLEKTGVDLKGKNAVVIGRSNTVGKPMAMLLLNADCTVTVCHSKTKNLAEVTKQADIVVVAIGRPKFFTEDMVKEGAIVIDVGINRVDGKLVGDVDFDNVAKHTSFITPVPGGVGPMTISMLLFNTLAAAEYGEN